MESNGPDSWLQQIEIGMVDGPVMYVTRMDAFLNEWFMSYDDALARLQCGGGYLLPHRGQFFITVPMAIRELGLDPDDPDWERIRWDWVRPVDREAWDRLCLKREVAG